MIRNTYNYVFLKDKVYGLGEAIIISKQKILAQLHELLVKPTNKVYTIFSKDHSVTLFQHYIFDSFQTHAVWRTKAYLDYIFDKNFKLTLAIKYEHNAATIQEFSNNS